MLLFKQFETFGKISVPPKCGISRFCHKHITFLCDLQNLPWTSHNQPNSVSYLGDSKK